MTGMTNKLLIVKKAMLWEHSVPLLNDIVAQLNGESILLGPVERANHWSGD
jgi:hypothetical protein